MAHHLCIAAIRGAGLPTSLLAVAVSRLLTTATLVDGQWHLTVVLIRIFLMAGDADHLFGCRGQHLRCACEAALDLVPSVAPECLRCSVTVLGEHNSEGAMTESALKSVGSISSDKPGEGIVV